MNYFYIALRSLRGSALTSLGAAALVLGCSSADDDAQPNSALGGRLEVRQAGASVDPAPDPTACQLPNAPRTFDESKNPEARERMRPCVPAFTPEQLNAAFVKIRDDRSLRMPEQPDFPRRISWLYPENGCEARANQAAQLLQQSGFPLPYFARATGKLGLDTPNDITGKVRWDGHVAPLVRVDEQLVVLDPAIEPLRPLALSEWLSRMSLDGSKTEWAYCQNYGLKEDCYLGAPMTVRPSGVEFYLGYEYLTQEMLGRDPERSLGDCPPWNACARSEPVADPELPPTIRRFASNNVWDSGPVQGESIYVLGSNFIAGVTTLRVTGNGMDALVPTESTLLRRIILPGGYSAGTYAVTAYNGPHASETLTMNVQ